MKFETNIRLPETLPIEETDLAVILSNGLENSINALENCDNRHISVNGFMEADKVYLEIKNPFNYGDVVFDGKMPKSPKENHGYGTKSMASLVRKYEGAYSFTVEDGEFIFRCSI